MIIQNPYNYEFKDIKIMTNERIALRQGFDEGVEASNKAWIREIEKLHEFDIFDPDRFLSSEVWQALKQKMGGKNE